MGDHRAADGEDDRALSLHAEHVDAAALSKVLDAVHAERQAAVEREKAAALDVERLPVQVAPVRPATGVVDEQRADARGPEDPLERGPPEHRLDAEAHLAAVPGDAALADEHDAARGDLDAALGTDLEERPRLGRLRGRRRRLGLVVADERRLGRSGRRPGGRRSRRREARRGRSLRGHGGRAGSRSREVEADAIEVEAAAETGAGAEAAGAGSAGAVDLRSTGVETEPGRVSRRRRAAISARTERGPSRFGRRSASSIWVTRRLAPATRRCSSARPSLPRDW